MTALLTFTALSPSALAFAAFATFVAGMVRGFSGFALSALVMASLTVILAPVDLIPICWFLEMSASALMVRGGFAEADKTVVTGLVIGSAMGLPVGLLLTTSVPEDTSKLIALLLILALAATQMARIRMPFLATKPGLYGSGFTAGIATGLASVGGMVVALYVLAQNAPARSMRASLVMFLFVSAVISFVTLTLYGLMTSQTVARGLILAIPAALGVIVGKRLFIPRFEPYYRPFCLTLLMGLAALGIVRMSL